MHLAWKKISHTLSSPHKFMKIFISILRRKHLLQDQIAWSIIKTLLFTMYIPWRSKYLTEKDSTVFIGKTNKLIFSEGWFIYPTTHLLTSLPLTHQFYNIRMKNTPLIFVVNVYRNCVRSCSLVCQATMVHLVWLYLW